MEVATVFAANNACLGCRALPLSAFLLALAVTLVVTLGSYDQASNDDDDDDNDDTTVSSSLVVQNGNFFNLIIEQFPLRSVADWQPHTTGVPARAVEGEDAVGELLEKHAFH